ncbi:MAG: hypothetical protein L6406_07205 [Desulfobacterales bacterium]|nr:hypothetical protein [Desulfobacterales bacterium]
MTRTLCLLCSLMQIQLLDHQLLLLCPLFNKYLEGTSEMYVIY